MHTSVSNQSSSSSSSSPSSSSSSATCLCSPTTHPGSFRCSFHRDSVRKSSHTVHPNQSMNMKMINNSSSKLSQPSQGLSHTDQQALQPKSSTTEEFQAKTHKVLFDEFIAISYCDRWSTLLGSFLKINLKFDLLFCTEINIWTMTHAQLPMNDRSWTFLFLCLTNSNFQILLISSSGPNSYIDSA